MRYIALWEYKDYNLENYKKHEEIHKARGERGEYVNMILPPHRLLNEPKGFIIFDSDDEMEVLKYVDDYSPILKVKIIPIVKGFEFIESYQKKGII